MSKPKEVFEQYCFEYTSSSIQYIMNSVNPDTVIFSGAFDSNFSWENINEDAVSFAGAITNAITCSNNTGIKKFIYISSCSVYEGNNEIEVDETLNPNSNSGKYKSIILGENICNSYQADKINEIAIVRIDEIYGIYDKFIVDDNICVSLCNKILKNEKVNIVADKKHGLICVDDAIDFIYKIIKAKLNHKTYYNVSSQCVHTEKEILDMIKAIHNYPIEVQEVEENVVNHNYSRIIIDNIGFYEKYSIENEIKNIYEHLKLNRKRIDKNPNKEKKENEIFTEENKNKIRPFIETLGIFIVIQIIAVMTGETLFFKTIDIYLLFVILMGVSYGSVQAIVATILSFIGKLYITMNLDVTNSVLNNEYIYLWTIQIFLIAILTGYLKDKYKRKYEDWRDDKAFLESELEIIKEVNESNIKAKNIYESRLINSKDSLGKMYDLVSKLDELEPEKIVFKAVSVIGQVMNSNEVAIYSCGKNAQYARLIASSSQKRNKKNKSLKLADFNDLFDKLKNNEIYINKTMDNNYPKMAAGTYNKGRLEMIICLWSLPFEGNNLYTMNNLSVVCKLTEKSLLRANTFLESIHESNYDANSGIMKLEAFKAVLKLYIQGKKEQLLDFTLLEVKAYENMDEKEFFDCIKRMLRETDYIGMGKDKQVYILLTNSNKEEASYVINRLQQQNIATDIVSEKINEVLYE